MKFGVAPELKDGSQFGDYTNVPDLLEAHSIIERATADFAELPAKVRDRFRNDPVEVLRFVSDKANFEEAVSLGLIGKPVGVSDSAPPPEAAGDAGISATPK